MSRTYIERLAREAGLPMKNATQPVIVVVTQHDVVYSRKANSKDCALACASRRIPGVKRGFFFRTTAWLERDDGFFRYALPQSVQSEIVAFDRSKQFAPGAYRLAPSTKTQSGPSGRSGNTLKRSGRKKPTLKHPLSVAIQKVWDGESGDLGKLQKVADSFNQKPQPKWNPSNQANPAKSSRGKVKTQRITISRPAGLRTTIEP